MSSLYQEAENDKAVLRIYYDETPEDPRNQDNLGTMICWHRRYYLGDEHRFTNSRDLMEYLVEETYNEEDLSDLIKNKIIYNKDSSYSIAGESYNNLDDLLYDIDRYPFNFLSDEEVFNLANKKTIILPLYLYDHSGITISTSPFGCPWDSGQVGWIYITYPEIEEEYGEITGKAIEKAEQVLKNEVKIYDMYLMGDVYGYMLEEKKECNSCGHIDYKLVDSCWGFYGDEFSSYLKEYIPEKYYDLLESLKHVG